MSPTTFQLTLVFLVFVLRCLLGFVLMSVCRSSFCLQYKRLYDVDCREPDFISQSSPGGVELYRELFLIISL